MLSDCISNAALKYALRVADLEFCTLMTHSVTLGTNAFELTWREVLFRIRFTFI